MSTTLQKFLFSVVGISRRGRLTLVHVTAYGIDDALGYAEHVLQLTSRIIFPGHILPDEDADEGGREDYPAVVVDMTAEDFALPG